MHFQIQGQHSVQIQPIQQQSILLVPNAISNICPQKTTTPPLSMSYRPDIDGLRTVAITLVIIYHAWPKALPGGFIGVDIFFVISGYLITQIIIKQTLKNNFSYIDFYSRRVKRIYPALLIVLIFTLLIAVKYSQKNQAQLTFNTLQASTVFSANIQILFYNQGYFDPDIRLNPLLHLWSLGVQQQFYIFWPCLIAIVLKKFQKKALVFLGVYAGLSFLFSIVAVYKNVKMAFYFPFFRFWQMAIGGILAYLGVTIQNKLINNALSIVALISIFISMFIVTDKSLFPGFWALIPTLSSAFIIQAKSQAFINKHILSSKLFVSIGKISYSLYLWHWPLLVFSKTFYPPGSTSIFANTFFIVFLTFVLTIATYFIAEDPIRKMRGGKIVLILLFLMITLGVTTLIINKRILPQLQRQKQVYTAWYLKQAQQQMKPRESDFVQKNSRRYPNLSASKNRTRTTTLQKVRTPLTDQRWDHEHAKNGFLQELLQRNIDETSMYYKKNRPQLDFFVSANEGKQNMLLIVGDSHTLKLSYRFQQLFFDYKKNNTLDKFPSIVAIIHYDPMDKLKYHQEMMKFSLEFAKEHKPKRILLVNHWYNRFCQDHDFTLFQPADCHPQRIANYTSYIVNYIKQYQTLGINVTLNAFDIQNHQLHPNNMIDFNGVIEQSIQPFKLSDFKRKYHPIIQQFQSAINTTTAQVIDLSEHLCWDDICEVISPTGHGVYVDNNHYGKFYVRHWLTSVDHLARFE